LKYKDENEEWGEKDPHLFVIFCNLRKYLADKNKVLLCKGCRIDVYPSGSQLKWIFALKGIRVKLEDEIIILMKN